MTSPEPNARGREEEAPRAFLIGPTAVGKSACALELAERGGFSIVSMDSMQVYRGMDVGTAKPTAEERRRVPHHLLDLVEPPERYDVQRYLADVDEAVRDVTREGRRPLFVGGTGFYLRALVHGIFGGPPVDLEVRADLQARAREEGSARLHDELASVDEAAALRIHPNDRKRVVRALEVWRQTGRSLTDWQKQWGWDGEPAPGRRRTIVGLRLDVERLDARIRERTGRMIDAGWPEEARRVREGPGFGPTSIQALGYREMLSLADGETSRAAAEEAVARATRQFARRQRTWFRRFPETLWVDAEESPRSRVVDRLLEAFEEGAVSGS